MFRRFHRTLGLFLALGAAAGSARGATSAWQSNAHSQVRLVSPYQVAPATGTVFFGLHFKLAPGWHVYWQDAGDSGYPPKITWEGSRGLTHPELLFPEAKKFHLPGDILAIGYEHEVVYPIRAERTQEGAVHAVAHVSYLTCGEICIPYKYQLTLEMPVDAAPQPDRETASLLARYQATVGRPPVEAVPESAPGSTGPSSTIWILLVAGLGGLILNVMPCVLPVLSIKLLGLVQHSGQSRLAIARHSLASAAGILVSFWGLALAAIVARRAGHAVGWGIQFQNPGFVIFLLVVVILFALNLWGVFEIHMPNIFGRFATSYGYRETLTSHFVSGLFVTLLATPCSAPFLGTAMGFALSQPSGIIFLIFTAVGLGMALPYFGLALFPRSIHWLPRPGAWILSLKKGMALLLLATAVWLGWVLHQQIKPRQGAPSQVQDLAWVPFDESAIASYLGQGKSVFVDVTADWCVTCKYNERFVLQNPQVVEEIKRQGLVLMKADWTNQNATIGAYLMKYGRAGIPFYALYRPGRAPVLLSEFLTTSRVLSILRS